MVAAIPPSMALQDAFFAAGLGFVLCLFSSVLRFVLGRSVPALIVCDVLLLTLGALLIRSAAVSRFYSGLPRWYDVLACVGSFFICRSALFPMFEKIRKICLGIFVLPGRLLAKKLLLPLGSFFHTQWKEYREKKRLEELEKKARKRKKRLQNTGRGLYNSK